MLNLRIAIFVACLLCIVCGLSAAVVGVPCATSITKYGVPGDIFSLTGPTATGGATYSYFWAVVDQTNTPITFTPNAQSQTISFTVPTATPPTSGISASVLITDTRTGGCALKSCVNLVINTSNTCSLINTTSMGTQICQTKTDPQIYQYTGSADLTNHQTAYLVWLVDGHVITAHDITGQFTYVWGTSPYNAVGPHTVTVQVHSVKSGQQLSDCSLTVNLLPPPDTTVT